MDNVIRAHMEAWMRNCLRPDEIDRARTILEKAATEDPEMFENQSYMTTLERNGFFNRQEG